MSSSSRGIRAFSNTSLYAIDVVLLFSCMIRYRGRVAGPGLGSLLDKQTLTSIFGLGICLFQIFGSKFHPVPFFTSDFSFPADVKGIFHASVGES